MPHPLKYRLRRLAASDPDFDRELRELQKTAGLFPTLPAGGAVQQNLEIVNQGDGKIEVSLPVNQGETAPEEKAPAGLGVSLKAKEAFVTDLLPELNRLVEGGKTPVRAAMEVMAAVDTAFEQKDSLYNVLIRSQSSFESDASYKDNLIALIESWVTEG